MAETIRTITGTEILAALNAAVESAGKDTTRVCVYVREEEPGKFEAHCIAGTVLADLGVPLDTLKQYENVNVEGIKDRKPAWGLNGNGPELPFKVDDEGWKLLLEAQYVQDDGGTWERALDTAKHYARRFGILND